MQRREGKGRRRHRREREVGGDMKVKGGGNEGMKEGRREGGEEGGRQGKRKRDRQLRRGRRKEGWKEDDMK